MACFLVPMTEAVVVSLVKKNADCRESAEHEGKDGISFGTKLGWLSKMLWGGSFLLVIEHIWHGEITISYPFLTAANDPAAMVRELLTAGVSMSLFVTAAWCAAVVVSKYLESIKSIQTEK